MSKLLVLLIVLAVLAGAAGLALLHAASFLRVNEPAHADVILVLAGGADDSRYFRAVELMKAGYAPLIVLDAEAGGRKFGRSGDELATEFVNRSGAGRTVVCPVYEDSTFGETADAQKCLAPLHPKSVLIVTSDYHSRRALSIFRKRLPKYHWAIAGAFTSYTTEGRTEEVTADKWWRNRRWAKTILEEWEKLLWWELVDQWRATPLAQ